MPIPGDEFSFACANEQCEYRYHERKNIDGNWYRIDGERPPLVWRLVGVCESVAPERAMQAPKLPMFAAMCPKCGRLTLQPCEIETRAIVEHFQLPIKPKLPGPESEPEPEKPKDTPEKRWPGMG